MSFINPRDPREVRAAVHTGYERYAQGIDMFPRLRIAGSADLFPRKTQPIAAALIGAWDRIDEDNAYFEDASRAVVRTAVENHQRGIEYEAMLVITQVGRNCVKLTSVSQGEQQPEASIGVFDRADFVEQFDGVEIQGTDGRSVVLRDGQMHGDFDRAVVRGSNVSGIMLPRQQGPVDVPTGSRL